MRTSRPRTFALMAAAAVLFARSIYIIYVHRHLDKRIITLRVRACVCYNQKLILYIFISFHLLFLRGLYGRGRRVIWNITEAEIRIPPSCLIYATFLVLDNMSLFLKIWRAFIVALHLF